MHLFNSCVECWYNWSDVEKQTSRLVVRIRYHVDREDLHCRNPFFFSSVSVTATYHLLSPSSTSPLLPPLTFFCCYPHHYDDNSYSYFVSLLTVSLTFFHVNICAKWCQYHSTVRGATFGTGGTGENWQKNCNTEGTKSWSTTI